VLCLGVICEVWLFSKVNPPQPYILVFWRAAAVFWNPIDKR
jgi:hypothetical protein